MKIDNSNAIIYHNKPCFTSCHRSYKAVDIWAQDILSQEDIHTTTGLLRGHIKWKDFIKDLIHHFAGKEKVNIYSMGCSDGSEGYSYAIVLADNLSKTELQKYYPIIGYDIDPEVIRAAQSGRINLEKADFDAIYRNIESIPNKSDTKWQDNFFKEVGDPIKIKDDRSLQAEFQSIYYPIKSYVPVGVLKNSVKFQELDLLTAARLLEDNGNSVVNTSHVLGYCQNSYIDEFLEVLSSKLKSGSWYVFDKTHNNPEFGKKLQDLGFFFPKPGECYVEKL